MKVVSICALAAAALSVTALYAPSSDKLRIASAKETYGALTLSITRRALDSLADNPGRSPHQSKSNGICSSNNLSYRREYGSLLETERRAYVDAVLCLQRLPARTPSSVASGAKSRFDDFIVTHINQTLTIHYTGNFLPWHRWFLYLYEQALRDECNYTGYHPYWDWPRYASSPETSPIFNGDPFSLGGNGEPVEHDGPTIVPPPGVEGGPIHLPAGVGGGYVTSGPFANMTVNLGPVGGLAGVDAGPDGGLGWNPRRLKRDVGPAMNERYANYSTVAELLLKPDITSFRLLLEGVPYTTDLGPHGGIHYVIGGDPGGDLFTSPGDPSFWVHHGMVDRMWTYWQLLHPDQALDLNASSYAYRTWQNNPISNLTQHSDILYMGYAGPSITIAEVMDVFSGPLCYLYV